MKEKFRRIVQLWNSSNALSAIGVLAAGILLAELNFLAARHYSRWDFSASQEFTISPASEALLNKVKQPIEVSLLLGRADPLLLDLNQIFEGYQALQPYLEVQQVDPEHERIEHARLLQEATANGANPELQEIAVLMRSGDKLRSLGREKLIKLASQQKGSRGLEAALSRAIQQIASEKQKLICFLTGHGEKSLSNRGPQGLSALRRSLRASDVQSLSVALTPVNPACGALALIGPTEAFNNDDLSQLKRWEAERRPLFIALDPIVDREGRIVKTGLNAFTQNYGIRFARQFLLERDKKQKLSQGIGEEFIGLIKTHPITEAINSYNQRRGLQVVVRAAAPISLSFPAQALVTTSDQAVTMDDLQSIKTSLDAPTDTAAPFAVVASSKFKENRAIFWGSSEMLTNQLFGDGQVTGNRVLLESAIAELLQEPLLMAAQLATESSHGLKIAESDLQDIFYYVLFWMPGIAAGTGSILLYMRRRRDQQAKA